MTHISGATSLIFRYLETGKTISRHLSDFFLVEQIGNFPNYYLPSKEELLEGYEENEEEAEIPVIDARGVDKMLLDFEKNPPDGNPHTMDNSRGQSAHRG